MRAHQGARRSQHRQRVVAAAALGAFAVAGVVAAQSTEPVASPPEPQASGPLARLGLAPLPIEPRGLPSDLSELCRDKPGGLTWIDRMQAGLYRSMCLTSARFDGFFGNARFDDEYESTHGSLAVGTLWDQRDEWDPSLRFRVNLRLPQLNDRLSAFVGRLDPDEYVSELRDDFDSLPRQFARADDDALLLGLGYRRPGPGGGHFDTGVGASLGWPLEPYAKGSYRLTQPFLERNVLRLSETIFWREDDGFGTTTRLDLERLLADAYLARWTGSATYAEETEGVRWASSLTLYHNLGKGRALAYQAGISGETDQEVDIEDYGLRVIFRRRLHRDWLFLELRSSVTWPRETLAESRETNWGAGFALEMQFGERKRK
jgi:hypothetical protein